MSDNIFSGLKVVDFSSFVAAPGAAVILGDFGADVIKVEPPSGDTWRRGYKVPPLPRSKDNYTWHFSNRNKRGLVLDLKSPQSAAVIERLAKWADVFIVNTPHPARKKLRLTYADVSQWNPRLIYADLTGYGDNGPDADLPGFDLTSYWARTGLLALTRDAGAPPTIPVPGSGDLSSALSLYGVIVTALFRRERTGSGSYVTTSLLASGIWSNAVPVQGALADASFYPLHDRGNPPNATYNVYKTQDDNWFIMALTPDHWPAFAKGIGRPDLLTDERFNAPAKVVANSSALTRILDDTFNSQPMSHWHQVFEQAHITFGQVRMPQQVTSDPQLRVNEIVVPLEGAGGKLQLTISSPMQVHGVEKVPAKRAPGLGEHNDEILSELGFDAKQIENLHTTGVVPEARHAEEATR
jgi:crotonobetainyl-CoA:carnitine CoA-transferase CaiB-like acyl-CoA transferase